MNKDTAFLASCGVECRFLMSTVALEKLTNPYQDMSNGEFSPTVSHLSSHRSDPNITPVDPTFSYLFSRNPFRSSPLLFRYPADQHQSRSTNTLRQGYEVSGFSTLVAVRHPADTYTHADNITPTRLPNSQPAVDIPMEILGSIQTQRRATNETPISKSASAAPVSEA